MRAGRSVGEVERARRDVDVECGVGDRSETPLALLARGSRSRRTVSSGAQLEHGAGPRQAGTLSFIADLAHWDLLDSSSHYRDETVNLHRPGGAGTMRGGR